MARSRLLLTLALITAAVSAAPAPAAPAKRSAGAAPLVLPGSARASDVRQTGTTWIVGGVPGAATAALAGRHGARAVDAGSGVYVIATSRARGFANALVAAGLLRLAEPDALAVKRAFPSDPLTPQQWWPAPVLGDPNLTPPPVTPASPLLGIVEEQIDLAHPDMQGIVSSSPVNDPPDEHGTAVAAVAGAPANGVGTVGIWPGMRILLPVYKGVSCSNITGSLSRAVAAKASVVNMSYGFQGAGCFVHLVATQKAFKKGVVLVAAAGNEFAEGNPLERPATDPHVVTVAALNRDLTSADFSNENEAVDVAAPGVGILTAVPAQFDTDGVRDGFQAIDGTSFAAPMVAAAATWLRAVRPALRAGQVNQVLQESADDLGPRGYDPSFGYGKVNLRDALTNRTPPLDPLEPNEDAEWVDGRRLGASTPPVFLRFRKAFNATMDFFEDPADVYRAVLPARSRVRFRMTIAFGDPDLDVYSGTARTILSDRGLLGRSRRSGRRPDTVIVRNTNRSRRTVLVNAYILEGAPLDTGYRLDIRRIGPA